MIKILCLALGLLLAAVQTVGAEPRRIELRDGTHLTGHVVSVQDGTYTIESPSLGQFQVPDSQILSIGAPGGTSGDNSDRLTYNRAELAAMQKSILRNEGLMSSIKALQSDQQIQALMQDPTVINAVQSGDLNALYNNPRFMELMNHPGIRAIRNQMLVR